MSCNLTDAGAPFPLVISVFFDFLSVVIVYLYMTNPSVFMFCYGCFIYSITFFVIQIGDVIEKRNSIDRFIKTSVNFFKPC